MMIEGNCKINLALNVEGILPNGYHSVKMIMQEITLCDEISLTFGKSGVSLSCSSSQIPTDNKNIAYRAAEMFYKETGIADGVHIHIEKIVPTEAGLGGGSADGAAVFKAMNQHYGYPLTEKQLLELGAKLGADIPFCIMGKTAVAEGIGEVLTPIESKIKTDVLIVKPPVGISTPWAYKRLDKVGFEPVDVNKVKTALEDGNVSDLCASMGNVFETVALQEYPEIAQIKADMLSFGASGAMMSGSGPSVFGIFEDAVALDNAYKHFKEKYKDTFKAKMI